MPTASESSCEQNGRFVPPSAPWSRVSWWPMFRPPTPRLNGTLLPGGSPSRPSPPGGAPLRSVPPLRSAPALTWPPAWAVTGCVSRADLLCAVKGKVGSLGRRGAAPDSAPHWGHLVTGWSPAGHRLVTGWSPAGQGPVTRRRAPCPVGVGDPLGATDRATPAHPVKAKP